MTETDNALQPHRAHVEPPPAGVVFGRLAFTIIKARGDLMHATAIAAAEGWSDVERAVRHQQKALVDPTAYSLLPAAMKPFQLDWERLMRARGVLAQLGGKYRRQIIGARVLRQAGGTSADFVGENSPFRMSVISLTDAVTLQPFQLATGLVLSDEVVKAVDRRNFVALSEDLADAIAEGFDKRLLDPSYGAVANISPASITNGATTRIALGASTVAALDTAFEQMIDGVLASGAPLTSAFWIFDASTLARMALMRSSGALAYPTVSVIGGTLAGLPIAVTASSRSAGSPSERTAVLLEASQLIVAGDGVPRIDMSSSASVQMNDAPSGGAQPLVSLWQNNLLGCRATMTADWTMRNPGAIAVLEGIQF